MRRLFALFRRKSPKPSPLLQEHLFRQALAEKGVRPKAVEIDHKNGMCWSRQTGWVPIQFPASLVAAVEKFQKTKTIKYFFSGMISEGREWLNAYPNVQSSTYGRNPQTKYSTDWEYYKTLSHAEFGLAPVGDCPWSYRFFESIMCRAIPVLGSEDIDVFASSYFFLRDGQSHAYAPDACDGNYETFLRQHTLAETVF